uniref:Reverse transcriptase-rnase h-integrase n=1 Tax=Moniliophthora roreri TaxID=221103 RepID=A0A0W0G5B0_MONRR
MVQKLNWRQARWSLFLSEFDLALVHVPGKSLTQADTLSQRSNEWEEEDMDNENVVMLLDSLFMKGINLEMQSEIMEWLGLDDFHKLALEQLLNQGMLPIKSVLSDWKIDVRLLFF